MKHKKRKKKIPSIEEGDFYNLFGVDKEMDDTADNFETLLELMAENPDLKRMQESKMKHSDSTLSGQTRRTPREIIKNYPAPQAELDLHGMTRQQAEQETLQFIDRSRLNGLKTLRIITGKGLHSKDGPVIREGIEGLLFRLKRQGLVFYWHWEKKERRKSGAAILYL